MPENTLQNIQQQVRQARLELDDLKKQLAHLRKTVNTDLRRQLLSANQQLVLTALDAQANAESANTKLDALIKSSQRDPLTNMPNRTLLLDRLQRAIVMAQRSCKQCAVVFVDIDQFKQINDTLGHAAGDVVLQLVAHRLETSVRDSDVVGRYGGDEFLVLLAELSRASDAEYVVRKIIADAAAPCLVGGHLVQISVSAGIATYPDDAQDSCTLIAMADGAMYRSKRLGGGCFTFYGAKSTPDLKLIGTS